MLHLYVDTPKKHFHPQDLRHGELAIICHTIKSCRQHIGQPAVRFADRLLALGEPYGCWGLKELSYLWEVRYLEPGECIQVHKQGDKIK